MFSFSCSCSLKERESQVALFEEETKQCKELYDTKVSETSVIFILVCLTFQAGVSFVSLKQSTIF